MEVVELVPYARNKWGKWWDYWFYVLEAEVEDHPGLPAAIMCSHYYVAYPPFEVVEDDENKRALRICWGPSASEGPQKHDLTMFLEYNV
jgi:hypothetical protein